MGTKVLLMLEPADAETIEKGLGSKEITLFRADPRSNLAEAVARAPRRPAVILIDAAGIGGSELGVGGNGTAWFAGVRLSDGSTIPVVPLLPTEPQARAAMISQASRSAVPGWLDRPLQAASVRRILANVKGRSPLDISFDFKRPLPRRTVISLGMGAFGVFLALWCILTYSGWVRELFLPSPTRVFEDLAELFLKRDFLTDINASVRRVAGGFTLASVLAIPLGLLMGSFRPVDALVRPICDFVRYMPAAAFIPLIILWLGIGHSQKVAVIFLGVFFYLLVMIAGVAEGVEKELIDTARTLGASRLAILFRVIAPASVPGVLEALRTMIGAAWTYLIVAELVAAQVGIGYRILEAQRFLQTGRVIAGILVIGAIGVVTDAIFRQLIQLVAPWRES